MLALLCLIVSSYDSYAGDKILNGGNVIVCKDTAGQTTSVELLDYYELKLKNQSLQFNNSLSDYKEVLLERFKDWEQIAPKRIEQYTQWLHLFEEEAGIYPNVVIPDILDTGSIVIPRGCELTPAAFQRRDEDIFPGEKRYVINKDLWDLMSPMQKAGLVLHELIYREAIKSRHETSLPTRIFNGYLASEKVPTTEVYFELVRKMPLKWAEFGGALLVKDFQSLRYVPGKIFHSDSFEVIASLIKTKDLEIQVDLNGEGAPYSRNITIVPDKGIRFYFGKPILSVKVKNLLSLSGFDSEIYYISYGEYNYNTSYPNNINLPFDNYLMIRGRKENYKVNPEESWLMNLGNKIENIVEIRGLGSRFITSSDQIWDHIGFVNEKPVGYVLSDYPKRKYFFYNPNKTIECAQSLEDKKIFECDNVPAKFQCQVDVYFSDIDGKSEFKTVTVEVKDTSKILVEKYSGTQIAPMNKYSILGKAGQIVGYHKTKFGKYKPHIINIDRPFFITWENKKCKLELGQTFDNK